MPVEPKDEKLCYHRAPPRTLKRTGVEAVCTRRKDHKCRHYDIVFGISWVKKQGDTDPVKVNQGAPHGPGWGWAMAYAMARRAGEQQIIARRAEAERAEGTPHA